MATARAGAVANARAPVHAQDSADDELRIIYFSASAASSTSPGNAFAANPNSGNAAADDVTDASAAQAQASPDDSLAIAYSLGNVFAANSVNDSDDDDDDTVRRLVAPAEVGENDGNADSDSEDETIKRLVMPANCDVGVGLAGLIES